MLGLSRKFLGLRNRHFFLLDILALLLLPTTTMMLRLDTMYLPRIYWSGLIIYTLTALIIRLIVFRGFGLYSRYWQYASVDELGQITLAVLVSTAILTIFILFSLTLLNLYFVRSVLIIDALLVLLAVGSTRFSVRYWGLHVRRQAPIGKRVLIVGAGDAGDMTVRELQKYPQLGMHPVAFVDDDPDKQGLRLRGLPVVGMRKDIPQLVTANGIDQVILAMPTAAGDVIREITGTCELLGVETMIVPSIHEIMHGRIRYNQLRKVQIEDLLRRDPVQTDFQAVRARVAGKRVLITGGGGSIGGELCRQLLFCGPSELIILGHGENSIFEISQKLQNMGLKGPKITPLIADVRFPDRIMTLLKQYRPHIIFHTAAHKHVPLMEKNPAEAITNNVLGTRNLLNAALAVDVEQFVMVSTDKAVNPTSVMGASKRTAELLVHQAAKQSGRPYVAVRFGNVLGSRGSVILTFKKQIAMGGPLTITDPKMTRFFMTIPEAVQLVLQASVLGNGGEVFVLDMGEPVKIIDLAKDLIRLSGLEEGTDIEITQIGLRPGEKLYEELFVPGEKYYRTPHQKIFIAGNASSFVPANLDTSIDLLAVAAERNDPVRILHELKRLIPEYQPMIVPAPSPFTGKNKNGHTQISNSVATLPQPSK